MAEIENLAQREELKPSVQIVGHAHIDMAWLWRLSHSREKAARTFATAQCWSGQPIATSAPCSTYGAASHSLYVDSVRIAFIPNNVVEWKIGTHRYECPCYLGGCSTPCSHAAPVVTQLTGSYTITADTVTLQFAQSPDPQASIPNTLKLRGSIPDRVPPDWAGPDSLLYGRVFGALIIKSP